MPASASNAPFSHPPLAKTTRRVVQAQLFLGFCFGAVALLLGLLVYHLLHLPRPGQRTNHQAALSQSTATPRTEFVAEAVARSGQLISNDPLQLPNLRQEKPQRHTGGIAPVLDAPLRLPDVMTADAAFEQRLSTGEKELRKELCHVPEVRLMSDLEVEEIRKSERAAQMNERELALAELNDAQQALAQDVLQVTQTNLTAFRNDPKAGPQTTPINYYQLAKAYQKVGRNCDAVFNRYQAAAKNYSQAQNMARREPRMRETQRKEQVGYETNLGLHQNMKQAAAHAGLELASGPNCQLTQTTAAEVAQLSKQLREKGFATVPGVPFVRRRNGDGIIKSRSSVLVKSQPIESSEEAPEDKTEAFQTWCDQHHLERLRGTVPTLTQMLQIEDEQTRLLLVRELSCCTGGKATAELATRAIVDLSPAVRQAALIELEKRPPAQYVSTLLKGLRYPWAPVADHAAVALRKLKRPEAIASLVDMLDLPCPSAPVLDNKTNRYTVREVIRLNHLRNCLLCHSPSANKDDGLVRGQVPEPGKPLPVQYYESQLGDFVRADITFLRQDFSVTLPEENAAPWPNEQRFDFVTRRRTVSPEEASDLSASVTHYPQRDAVLYALRGLTGKDWGDSSSLWRDMLGLSADDPKADKLNPQLGKICVSTPQPNDQR